VRQSPVSAPCPACGAAAREAARYCEDCGAAITSRCPGCGATIQGGKRFCARCGEPVRLGWADDAVEHRQTSVIALAGADIAVDTALIRALEEIAQDLGGAVVPLPEGLAVVFGAPRSLEDHLQRARLAALRVVDGEPQSSFSGGVGVASGRLLADPGMWSEDAAADGPIAAAISLATDAAASEVLVEPSLLPVIPDAFQVEPTEGRAGAADAQDGPEPHRVVGMRAGRRASRRRTGRSLSRFVGRERQLRLVDDALGLAESGAGQVIGVVAEPGMGKSRLVEEAQRSSVGRARWVEGRCVPYGAGHPYLPVLDLVRELCDVPLPGRADAAGAVERAFARLEAPPRGAP